MSTTLTLDRVLDQLASKLGLTEPQLAGALGVTPRTLERWHWLGQGPRFLKIGGKVIYRLADIEAYEAEQLRSSTVQPGAR